ncbi:hypothetical protein G9A89_014471 [Geosiphon pyriformis]|nr:hypothetical protein G9A89_014471 [Geosiphon pyriformis]
MINYVFVSSNLVNAIMQCGVFVVSEYFDTDHRAVSVSLGLGGLLDTRLNSLRKQTNKDRWKFNFKGADEIKWNNFKHSMLANTVMFSGEFAVSVRFLDLDAMWCVDCQGFMWEDAGHFVYLMKCWSSVDNVKFSVVQNLIDSEASSDCICFALFGVKKSYCASKLAESLRAKKANIKSVINRRMESFKVNKGHIIRSILECPFHKVVLDHLVVNDDLILEPDLVKSKTRKCHVANDISIDWRHQYQSLKYVFDEAFSGVMCPIGFDEFFEVVSDLLDDKAAGLSGISNELWKHCNKSVLDMLLVILNLCLSDELSVLTNTHLIALIETARKILSKILSDRISLACSAFDILHGDNFLVLKGTTTQSSIFAIGLVVEDALEKDRELWLVLQNMWKAYNSVGWEHLKNSLVRIKMCSKFIHFFGNIHNDHTNWVMTDFGLTNEEVFSPLLWQIFYDLLLCKVKHQESVCGYRLNSHFISKNGHVKSCAKHSSFFAAGIFVDDMIWVGSSQSATQHILNIASEFFQINDISINNNKTVVIPINSRVSNSSLTISGLPISITKKGESYRYLGIFFSTEGLSKFSLVRAYSDVCFFTNLVLKKAVLNKQFLYLVSVVLHPIVSYKIQFSFISVGVCNKWDALICKSLKLKSGLLLNFLSDTIHHPFFYSLKSFSQCQSESKIALLISFANSSGILGHLFSYRSYDLQLVWLTFFSTAGYLWMAFWPALSGFMVEYLCLLFLKRLDSRGPVPDWFNISVAFLVASCSFLSALAGVGPLNIHGSNDFVFVCDYLSQVDTDSLSVYMDGSVKNLDTIGCRAEAAAFFENINLGLGVGIQGLMLFTLVELQAIVLALEYVSVAHSVYLFLDSQTALDACKLESDLVYSDFHNQYWYKVKSHSDISGNNYADSLANTVSLSGWYLLPCVDEHFLLADGGVVSGNSRHFVHDVFYAVCRTHWEVGSGFRFLDCDLCSDVNWLCFSRVWHPDLHMTTGFTSRLTANTQTYLMKTLYCQFPVAVWKHIYNKCYLSVLCLYCGKMEVSNHVFFCVVNDSARCQVLESCMFS